MSSVPQPIQNALLQAADQAGVALPSLVTWMDVGAGETLVERGATPAEVYFPESAVLSFVSELADGKSLEVASVGRNGCTAALALLGGEAAVCSVVVTVPGRVACVSAAECMREMEASPALAEAVSDHSHEVFRQTQQSTACAAFHSVEGRVATWILLASERAGGGRIVAAHHTIGRMLGVRRASVSDVATRLRSRGLIDYIRGSFLVLDAAALREVACSCCAELSTAAATQYDAESDVRSASGAPRVKRTVAVAPIALAQMTDVRQRTAAAREAMQVAVRHCATFMRHSIYRISKSGRALDESERVVQQLRRAVEFYSKALEADNTSSEVTITMVTGLVDQVDAPVSEKGMLRAAAAQWAVDALQGATPPAGGGPSVASPARTAG